MTAVKDQCYCGSCWAFASGGVIEAQYNIASNNSNLDLDLSEENLVSNASSSGNCGGGIIASAFNYIKTEGVVNESCFPYVDSNCHEEDCSTCTYSSEYSNAKDSDNQCNSPEAKHKIDDYQFLLDKDSIKNWIVITKFLSIVFLINV
jgi:cathepsin C